MDEKQKEEASKYAIMIAEAIIDRLYAKNFFQEVKEGDDLRIFAHALANLVPILILSQISDRSFKDTLEFNHYANRLILEFNKKNKAKKLTLKNRNNDRH